MKFVPRHISREDAAQGYNNEGRGKMLGYISDAKLHEATCPYRKSPGKAVCACRIGLWQEKTLTPMEISLDDVPMTYPFHENTPKAVPIGRLVAALEDISQKLGAIFDKLEAIEMSVRK